jgi:glycosyltransferase involved in cell wall biosynthesis
MSVRTWDRGRQHLNGVADDEYEGIPVRRLDLNWSKAPRPFDYLYNNPVTKGETGRLIDAFQPDVVHVTSASTLSVSVIFEAKGKGIPVVLTLADFWFICPRFTLRHADGHLCSADVPPQECTRCLAWNAKIHRWLRRVLPERAVAKLLDRAGKIDLLTRQRGCLGMIGNMAERRNLLRKAMEESDEVLSPSRFVRDAFRVQGMPADRIQPLAWGMPTGWTLPRQSPEPSLPVRVRYLGRIDPSKGVDVLVRAFRHVTSDARLYVHGSGPRDYGQLLQRLAGTDSRIAFAGPYQRDALGGILQQTDVTVVPSLWPETFCLVPSTTTTVYVV